MPGAAVTFDCGASGSAESGTLRGAALCAPPPPYPDYPRSHNRSRSGKAPPEKTKLRERVEGHNGASPAPALRLEPIEADSTADKGAKRVRVDSTEESSTQSTAGPLLTTCQSSGSPALGTGCECSKDPFGSRSTLPYYHSKRQKAVHYNTLR
eukprot:scaffold7503_cov146-Isochrysis_galbana.AAC.3